jgi:hypothetical protein
MNIKKTRTIGIRTDEHFIKLLDPPSEIYNTSKSEILRNAVMQCYGLNVIQQNRQFSAGPFENRNSQS